MKKFSLLLVVGALSCIGLKAQKLDLGEGTFQSNFGFDVFRTPGSNFGNIQPSLDLNYFVAKKFALGVGFNYSSNLKTSALEPGLRWYPFGALFLRTRAAIPTTFNSIDGSVGLGYDWALSDKWAIETNGDYYLRAGVTVFRFGFALFL